MVFKKGDVSWIKNKHLSKRHRMKLSEVRKGKIPWNKNKKGFKHSEKSKLKMSLSRKGLIHTGSFKKGRMPWNTGKQLPTKIKKKISLSHKGKCLSKETIKKLSGKNAHNWQGGISFEPYTTDWTDTLKKSIRERDHYVCRICRGHGHHVHHIDYNKENCNVNNLITLCIKCHGKTNQDRDNWIKFFSHS